MRETVAYARKVWQRISNDHLLTPDELNSLGKCGLNDNLWHSVSSSTSSLKFHLLWRLLDEEWLGESIIDDEGLYVMQYVNSLASPTRQRLHLLECYFGVELEQKYRNDDRFSTSFCSALPSPLPECVAFIYNKIDSHWAACVIDIDRRIVFEGDSLGYAPMASLRTKIGWLFRDLIPEDAWTFQGLSISRQPAGRSGSCGIVAMNAIERFMIPSAPVWVHAKAREWRGTWIQRRLRDHLFVIAGASNRV
jgi:Ulp1 family protease